MRQATPFMVIGWQEILLGLGGDASDCTMHTHACVNNPNLGAPVFAGKGLRSWSKLLTEEQERVCRACLLLSAQAWLGFLHHRPTKHDHPL